MDKKIEINKKVKINDSIINSIFSNGINSRNDSNINNNRITNDVQLLNNLYREHWLVKKIINSIPEDMMKNGYKVKSNISSEKLYKLNKLERKVRLKSKIIEGLQWGRLYGGAAGIIVIEDHEDILQEPLELDMVMPDSFKGLIIIDRHSGVFPEDEIITDINDDNFGLPKYYTIKTDEFKESIKVHHSRIVRFIGRELPHTEMIAEQYWGASELERIYEELQKRDNTSFNMAMLVFSANLKVFKMKGMEEMALLDSSALEDLYKTYAMSNELMNNEGMLIMGAEDDFSTHDFSFAGLAEVYETMMLDLAGAAEMPATKLFGRSPSGLNATGEGDIQNYYDFIEVEQESDLRSIVDKLLPIMAMSAWGYVPDDLDYEFNPCRKISEQEQKNIGVEVSNSIATLYTTGIITKKTALKELQQLKYTTGMLSSITDDDIKKAIN